MTAGKKAVESYAKGLHEGAIKNQSAVRATINSLITKDINAGSYDAKPVQDSVYVSHRHLKQSQHWHDEFKKGGQL